MFKYDIGRLVQTLKKDRVEKISLQIPAGMKTRAVGIAQEFIEKGIEVQINIDPCYGACDLCPSFGSDAIVHFGHSKMVDAEVPVYYVEVQDTRDPSKLIESAISKLGKTVCVLTTVQHVDKIPKIKEILEKNGKKAVLGMGQRTKYKGQVLGCDFGAAVEADSYLYYGTGDFHPIGIALKTGKDVIVADVEMNKIRSTGEIKKKVLYKRHAAIEKCRDAKMFGILVSTKAGQKFMKAAERVQKDLRKDGREGIVIYGNNLGPDNLLGLKVNAFVSTACPRIAIDDYSNYGKPVINADELDILLGKSKWEDYEFHYP